MAKSSRASGAKDATCDKCELTAKSVIPNRPHRRCSGLPKVEPRAKHCNLPGTDRGTWR